MKQVLRGTGGEGRAQHRATRREGKIEGEEINYLGVCGWYGRLQLPVGKWTEGRDKMRSSFHGYTSVSVLHHKWRCAVGAAYFTWIIIC